MMNPVNQFIEVAPDCALDQAQVPEVRGGKQSIAAIEYELLSGKPYGYTLEELKFATYVKHKNIVVQQLKSNYEQIKTEFLSKPYACMRASPLTKKYGWGAHYDEFGKIAIYAVESQPYQDFVSNPHIRKYFAMRSKRA